jgi:hypothetical protein
MRRPIWTEVIAESVRSEKCIAGLGDVCFLHDVLIRKVVLSHRVPSTGPPSVKLSVNNSMLLGNCSTSYVPCLKHGIDAACVFSNQSAESELCFVWARERNEPQNLSITIGQFHVPHRFLLQYFWHILRHE